MGAVAIAETGMEGTAETCTVGTTETGIVGMAEMGAISVARGVAVGILVSTATPGPLKVSTNREIGIQIKGDRGKGVTQMHMYKEEMTKRRNREVSKKEKGEKGTYP